MYDQFPYLLTRSFIYMIVAEENGRTRSTSTTSTIASSNRPREVKPNDVDTILTARTWERGWAWLVLKLCEHFGEIVRFLKKMDGPSRNLDKANFSPKKKGK